MTGDRTPQAVKSMLAQVRARFRQGLPGRIDELKDAYERGLGAALPRTLGPDDPWTELRMLAHKLGGTAGSYGFGEVSRITLAVERLLRGALDAGQLLESEAEQLRELMAQLVEHR